MPVIIATGRMFRSVRPYALAAGMTEPVVCYQGAVVADPVGGEFLRHVPMPMAEALEVIDATAELGYTVLCYVDDELYVAARDTRVRRLREFQDLTVHVVGDLATWLEQAPTKLVTVGDPRPTWTAANEMQGAVRRPALHLEVPPPLPRVRRARR